MLKVQYQIPVNAHSAEQSEHLSSEQLWMGLLLRILEPMRFTIGLDNANINQTSEVDFERTLFFGEHEIRDRVVLEPKHRARFTTEATDKAPSGQLTYEIIEDGDHGLMLQCEYATEFPEPARTEEKNLLEMVKNAYRMADEDMVRIIREYMQMSRH